MKPTEQNYASFLNKLLKSDRAFVCFIEPLSSEPEIHILPEGEKAIPITSLEKLSKSKGFIIAPFQIKPGNPAFLLRDAAIIKGYQTANFHLTASDKYSLKPFINNSTSFSDYSQSFQRMMNEIEEKRVQKVVLSRKLSISHDPDLSYGDLFMSLRDKCSEAYRYLINIPEMGAWMGATPEILLKGQGASLSTIALAGTLKFSGEDLNTYQWGSKEIEEQDIVSRYINNCLKQLNADITRQEGPKTIAAGSVVHLKTEFFFNLPDYKKQLGRLIENIYPTPAVCGLPKEEATDIILETENHNREFYSGFLGTIGLNDEVNLYVNLRCMKITFDHFQLFAGGGLTIDSDCIKEWEETNQKIQTLLTVIENYNKSK